MSNSVSIVIVNWNAGHMLFDCCQSIASSDLSGIELREVIIVDNGSTDRSVLKLNSLSLPMKIIQNEINRGFATACNQGAAFATGEFILYLNPDTRLYFESLKKSVIYLTDQSSVNVGICGIRLEDGEGGFTTSFANFPSVSGIVQSAIGFRFQSSERLPIESPLLDQPVDVDQVIGAYFLIRSQLFRHLGGFDERFFVYFEEVDLSLRARQAGWRSVCLPTVAAFHFGGGSSQQIKAARLFYSLRSRLLYAFKHFSWMGAFTVLVITLLVEPLSRLVLALLRRSYVGVKDTCVAYGMLWRWLPQWMLKGKTS